MIMPSPFPRLVRRPAHQLLVKKQMLKQRKKLSLIAAGVESPDRTGPTIADEEAEV